MIFHPKPDFPQLPTLQLNGTRIQVQQTVKFLGLTWDSQLTWKKYIDNLIISCNKSLNLLRTLSSLKWGADQYIMLHTYKLIIRPKLDYGCIVYGASNDQSLKRMESIQNEALRICLGAFTSSPVESLRILSNQPSLADRRDDLLCRYFIKSKCFLSNPVHNDLHNNNFLRTMLNSEQCNKAIISRTHNAVNALQIVTQPVLPFKTPQVYSWTLLRPNIDTELVSPNSKSIPNFNPIFRNHVDYNYPNYRHIYTDGSKGNQGVGSAAIFGHRSLLATPPKIASIYTAELYALKLAI